MTTDITALAQSLKNAASKALIEEGLTWFSEEQLSHEDGIAIHKADAEFIALANPANVLALVEALESEKRICATWRKTAEANSEKLEKAQTINAAAEKLVRCKGRYHSEQNYRALAALFGVKTPDLPPLEHENVHHADAEEMEIETLRQRIAELESRTVKLPKLKMLEDYLAEVAIEERKQILVGVKLEFHRALAAAGIKVEAE